MTVEQTLIHISTVASIRLENKSFEAATLDSNSSVNALVLTWIIDVTTVACSVLLASPAIRLQCEAITTGALVAVNGVDTDVSTQLTRELRADTRLRRVLVVVE